jgi:hypothetical protein
MGLALSSNAWRHRPNLLPPRVMSEHSLPTPVLVLAVREPAGLDITLSLLRSL